MTGTETDIRHLLAADIGGTHSRFGHFLSHADGRIEEAHTLWLPTREAASFGDMLAALGGAEFPLRPREADAAVFAVPGPMSGPVGVMGTASSRACRFANIPWDMDLDRDGPRFGLANAALVNDFAAQAQAFRTPLAAEATAVLPGRYDDRKVRAVIAAGTGLGMAALIPLASGGHQVASSEGGHASRSFRVERKRTMSGFWPRPRANPTPRATWCCPDSGLSLAHTLSDRPGPAPGRGRGGTDPGVRDHGLVRRLLRPGGQGLRPDRAGRGRRVPDRGRGR